MGKWYYFGVRLEFESQLCQLYVREFHTFDDQFSHMSVGDSDSSLYETAHGNAWAGA